MDNNTAHIRISNAGNANEVQQPLAEMTTTQYSELADLQLSLVGGGCGETIAY